MKSTARAIFGPDTLAACALKPLTVTASAVTLEREVTVPDGFTSRERLVEYGGKPYCVPQGKRLVIESVSGALEAPSDEKAFRIWFRSDSNGAAGPKHWLLCRGWSLPPTAPPTTTPS